MVVHARSVAIAKVNFAQVYIIFVCDGGGERGSGGGEEGWVRRRWLSTETCFLLWHKWHPSSVKTQVHVPPTQVLRHTCSLPPHHRCCWTGSCTAVYSNTGTLTDLLINVFTNDRHHVIDSRELFSQDSWPLTRRCSPSIYKCYPTLYRCSASVKQMIRIPCLAAGGGVGGARGTEGTSWPGCQGWRRDPGWPPPASPGRGQVQRQDRSPLLHQPALLQVSQIKRGHPSIINHPSYR